MRKPLLRSLTFLVIAVSAAQGWADAENSDPKRLLVVFPNDARQSFVVRGRPASRDLDSDRTIAEQLPELIDAASRGDGGAADATAQALQYCADAYVTEAEVNAAVDVLMQSGRLTTAGTEGRTLIIPDQDSRRHFAEELREQRRRCSGMTAEIIAAAASWREVALRTGNVFATQDYAGFRGRTEEGLAAWEAAWKAGSVAALHAIGSLYARGVRPLTVGSPNYIEAYAYKLLHLKLQEANSPAAQSQARRMFLAKLQEDLDQTGGNLDPGQWAIAVDRAQALLVGNANCCIVH